MNKSALVGLFALVGCGGSSGAGLTESTPIEATDAGAVPAPDARAEASVVMPAPPPPADVDADTDLPDAAPGEPDSDAAPPGDAGSTCGSYCTPVAVTCVTSAGPRTCNPALQQVSVEFFLPSTGGGESPTWCNPGTGTGTAVPCPHGAACTAFEGASSWSGTCQ